MQKPQQQIPAPPPGHGGHGVLGGAAVAPPSLRARGSASPAAPNPEVDPSVSSAASVSGSSGLPFGSLPAWPQTHLLQHQGQAAVDGQLQSHLYLQHALHLAQRAIQQQGSKAAPGSGNMKLQEFMQLQSAMAAAQDRALSQQHQQLSRSDAAAKPQQTSPPGNQNQGLQQQRVPSSMAFLFGQNPQSLVGSSPVQPRPGDANPRNSSPQQFMSPEMLQARMLAMQQQQHQQQQQQQKLGSESPHLRLGTQMISSSSSEQEAPPPSNVAGFGHASDLLPNLRGGFPQQHQQQQLSSSLGNGLAKPDMNSSSSAVFPMLSRQQHPRAMLENQTPVSMVPSQHLQQQAPAPATAPAPANDSSSQHAQQAQQGVKTVGFTIQQLMVLRAQILAFRRLKRGDRSFTTEMIRVITPTPLVVPPQKQGAVAVPPPETSQPKVLHETADEKAHRESPVKTQEGGSELEPSLKGSGMQQTSSQSEAVKSVQEVVVPTKPVVDEEKQADSNENNGIDLSTQPSNASRLPKTPASKRYRGPLFDFPPLGKKPDASLLPTPNAWGPPASLKYDVRELLIQEGLRRIGKKKAKKLKVIEMLLSDGNLNVPSELKLKLRIEQRKLVLLKMQGKVRNEIEEQQQEIMAMGDRAYRKFVRLCERQRMEISRQVMVLQKTSKDKYLKGIFQWRKKLLESHWSARDSRINRNRGIAKFHEKLLREYSKRKDEDRSKRMEALKNNDVDAYRAMLIKQQKEIPGDAQQRFEVLESFLSQTEDYLHKLGGKISSVKNQQEREEAALAAASSARSQGFSEEEVERAATQASEAVALRSWNCATNSVNKYYTLAHAVNEQILRQPSMLRAGILRDYQLVGLQWMLSLYNNRLNGILADEMGLGKTVQVMALIAYLMEFKGNYGPHLIIVPNAVIVNWKSELLRWLPSVSSIFYVGVREDRSRIYSQEVAALKFNVLVTTYEFIMRDRSKLAKVDWKYIIIDEAQRMKDRESRLARDLDRFRCQRRLLLTGTPLQNDLHELWSLLNLLLPEVFDNSKAFHDWFSKPFQRDANTLEDDWLETEKKVIVIHRLHQILEPFMLRRRVEDVEGSLPPKVPVVLKCKMSSYQAAIYDWVKATGTIRLDPADEEERVASGNGKRQARAYAPLQNKCMELRKVCNHPYLNYPPHCRLFSENMVRMCGKLWILDRILIKLQRSGHRVLLFSTMTKLLDILEDYLQWRGLIYRRIDGTTPLDSRETAIVDFNAPGSQCFIFLLSIRAAGRGLNLQTADTVVIYDPDPNPKNEEQAVARAHRIGQKSEVKVIYMEAVVESFTSYQMEDELRNGGSLDVDDDMAGKDRYLGSVESLVRNNIQQHKIDMADEVINAGRFDQRTTHEERRMTLEALLHDEERYQESVHDVPTLKEVNRMIARSEEEVELFDQMDEECDWPGEMVAYDEVPEWLHVGSDEVNAAIKATSKQALVKGFSGISGIIGTKAEEDRILAKKALSRKNFTVIHDHKALKPVRRGRPPFEVKVPPTEIEDDEDLEEAVVEEESSSGEDEEEGEIRDGSDEEEDDTGQQQQDDADEMDDEAEAVAESSDEREGSPEARVEVQVVDSKKFGSLAELGSRSNQDLDGEDLEEGEIAASGDSPGDSPSEKDPDEDQIVEPRRKRKRSARHRRQVGVGAGNVPVQGVFPVGFLQTWPGYTEYERPEVWSITPRPASFIHTGFANWSSQAPSKQIRVNGFQELAEEVAVAEMRESRTARGGARMQDNVQKKCKAVLSKLQGAMNKDGRQVSALLMELPKRHELPEYYKVIDKPIDAKTIEEHLERFDYATVLDFAGDVQLMLDNASRYNTHNAEVQADARRLHSLFFQRMGLMFPDVDFNSIKINIGIRMSGSRSSRKQRQVFAEASRLTPAAAPQQEKEDEVTTGSNIRGKESSSKDRKKMRPGDRDREGGQQGQQVTHPADLVICKRKRNSRRKPRIKASNKRKRGQASVEQGSSSTTMSGRKDSSATGSKGGIKSMVDDGGPLSWARARKVYSVILSSSSPSPPIVAANRDGGNDGTIHHPRKKSRTDTARRRPSSRL